MAGTAVPALISAFQIWMQLKGQRTLGALYCQLKTFYTLYWKGNRYLFIHQFLLYK